ncbi:MAG: DPP IV N-terminal domain-containing protein, partial [Flavobacteriales bacterium]|nr:DPP IV N-terminal domain-containing protein [Flavobacteriales bacterium]
MTFIKYTLFASILFFGINSFCQDKELTLEDAVLKRWTDLRPETIKQLHWTGKEGQYCFSKKEDDESYYVLGNINSNKTGNLISLTQLNNLLELSGENVLLKLPSISWIGENDFSFHYNNSVYLYDIEKKNVAKVLDYSEKAANKSFAKKTLKIAYTVDDNLFVVDAQTEAQITNDGGNGIVNGQAVHRFEFGIMNGIFWSPHENFIAFYRKDESMVADYPLVDISTKPASLNSIKYPMAGENSHQVTVDVYNTQTKKITFLKTGEPKEQYLTNIAWGPNEKYIYVAVLNRDQNHLKFNKYDIATGELITTLFEEKDEQYVQPLHPMFWLKDHNRFVWNSQKEGYRQLYLYGSDGKVIRKLTETNWDVLNIMGEDKSGENLIFTGTGENGSEKHVFSVEIATGKITNLSKVQGTHRVKLNAAGTQLIDQYSSTTVASETRIIDTKGKVVKPLLKSKNPLEDYKVGTNEIFTIKAADNKTDLYCRIIKPYDFDESKKYPTLVYVYNGPGVQLITNSYVAGASLWMYEFANRGYIVFTVDGRGSSNRGEEFEQITFRNLGDIEIEDQLKGVEYLKSLPFVNADKMAVHGWSYGGFMTTRLMLKSPNTFKVGVAGGPVIDWKYYEIMYTERYMDTPQTNPDGYKNASLLNYVENLEGKLLMIHGTIDDVVVWQHSLDFVETCLIKGVQIDYF